MSLSTLELHRHFYGPAVTEIASDYPAVFDGRIPKRIQMTKTVRADLPGSNCPAALRGEQYACWVNQHGAVAACVGKHHRLGLKPEEFFVVEWHEFLAGQGAAFLREPAE